MHVAQKIGIANYQSLTYELKKHDFFNCIDSEGFGLIVKRLSRRQIPAKKSLFEQGDQADAMYIILCGALEVYTISEDGKTVILDVLGRGEILGEIATLDGGFRTASVRSITNTQLVTLSRADILILLKELPQLGLSIINALCGRLRKADVYIENIRTLSSEERLARVLFSMFEKHGIEQTDGSLLLPCYFTQGSLGAHASLTRENVNRHIRRWKTTGILKNERHKHILLNPIRLKTIAYSSK